MLNNEKVMQYVNAQNSIADHSETHPAWKESI
jgi:hypothetical protein